MCHIYWEMWTGVLVPKNGVFDMTSDEIVIKGENVEEYRRSN